MQLSSATVEFSLFYDGPVDVRVLLTRSQCRVSDTQVTIKALGPLVFILWWGCWYVKYEPFWQDSDIQVTLKAHMVLLFFFFQTK